MAKKFDRSKYKATKSLLDQEKELKQKGVIKDNVNGNNLSSVDYIKFDKDGDYLVRFWPSHDPNNFYFVLPVVQYWIEAEKFKKDSSGKKVLDQSGNPMKEWGRRPIYSSITQGNLNKDIIDEYIKCLKNYATERFGEKRSSEKDAFLNPLYNKDIGIQKDFKWVAYASFLEKNENNEYVSGKFGELKFTDSVSKKLRVIAAGIESDDGLIDIDPFSRLDDALVVKVTRNSKTTDLSNYYTVSQASTGIKNITHTLSDEEFSDKFEDLTPLNKRYCNVYKYSDFETAVNALQRFDATHGYNIFATDEFMNICEEISDSFEDEEEANTEKAVADQLGSSNPVKQEEPVAEVVEETPQPQKETANKLNLDDIKTRIAQRGK